MKAAAPTSWRRSFVFLETLRIRDFRYVWLSNGINQTSFQIRNMGQAWLVLEMTDSTFWVGAANGLPAIPIMFFSLLGGVLADRMDRKMLLVYSRLILAGVAFLTGFLITAGVVELWHIIALALAAGTLNAINRPASQVIVFDIVGRQRLMSAVSLNSTISNLGTIGGPSVGGVLIARLGVESVFYVMAAAYLAATAIMLFVSLKRGPRRHRGLSIFRDLFDGIRYARSEPHIAWLLILAVVAIFSSFYFTLVPIYARDVLDVGPRGYGYMLGIYGIGSLLASVGFTLMGDYDRKSRMVVLASVLFSLSMLVFAFSRTFYLSLACSFAIGVAAMTWVNNMTVVVQTSASEEMRGRVTSLLATTMQLFPLGWLIGGVLAERIGNQPTLIIGGLCFMTATLVAYASSAELRRV